MTLAEYLVWALIIGVIAYRRVIRSRAKNAYDKYRRDLQRAGAYDAPTLASDFERHLKGREETVDREVEQLEGYLASLPPPNKIRL